MTPICWAKFFPLNFNEMLPGENWLFSVPLMGFVVSSLLFSFARPLNQIPLLVGLIGVSIFPERFGSTHYMEKRIEMKTYTKYSRSTYLTSKTTQSKIKKSIEYHFKRNVNHKNNQLQRQKKRERALVRAWAEISHETFMSHHRSSALITNKKKHLFRHTKCTQIEWRQSLRRHSAYYVRASGVVVFLLLKATNVCECTRWKRHSAFRQWFTTKCGLFNNTNGFTSAINIQMQNMCIDKI